MWRKTSRKGTEPRRDADQHQTKPTKRQGERKDHQQEQSDTTDNRKDKRDGRQQAQGGKGTQHPGKTTRTSQTGKAITTSVKIAALLLSSRRAHYQRSLYVGLIKSRSNRLRRNSFLSFCPLEEDSLLMLRPRAKMARYEEYWAMVHLVYLRGVVVRVSKPREMGPPMQKRRLCSFPPMLLPPVR